eukprot:s2693_g3.t1
MCNSRNICERTQEKHLKWRPATANGAVVQFHTGDEREYPSGFCAEYAKCAMEVLGRDKKFIEVFSGPNAPLSAAVCHQCGEELQGHRVESTRGIKQELQRLAQVVDSRVALEAPLKGTQSSLQSKPEVLVNRHRMLEAMRQPSYGKRQQLISDGLECPLRHMEEALKLEHPFCAQDSLKDMHQTALNWMTESPGATNTLRLRALAEWRLLAKSRDVLELQSEHEAEACDNAKRLGRKPRTALMSMLQARYHIEDCNVPWLCLKGMPIVGEALQSPFFEPKVVPAAVTLQELLSTASRRRNATLEKIRYMAKKGSEDQAQAIYRKTLKEVAQGSMAGPYTHEDIVVQCGPHYNLIPSFGLEQGIGDDGLPKYRRIDDHTAGFTNLAATRMQRIDMAMTDYLIVMIKCMFSRFHGSLDLGSEDMQSAYRQVPLLDSQVAVSITGVYDPSSDQVRLFKIFGQPFGAGHAVPNFYRLAEWACRLLVRGMGLMLDHFFDDFYYVDRRECSKVTAFCLQQAFALPGLQLDPNKSQVPKEVAHILGVAFNTASLAHQRTLLVEPKPLRKENFTNMVRNILTNDWLPPTLAASVVGKFGFLCSTLFGKVGRFCTGYVRERQYSQSKDSALTAHLRLSLQLMMHIVNVAPHRVCSFGPTRPPCVLYTDASDVPHREPRFGIGGVLVQQVPTFSIQFFSSAVPQAVVDQWIPKATFMGQLEVLAAPVAIQTWAPTLAGQQIIHFIDSDAAAASLVKGYSPKSDSTAMVGEYWSLAAQSAIDIYIDRVESKSNLADGPSRFELDLMDRLSALQVSQMLDLHYHPSTQSRIPFVVCIVAWVVHSAVSCGLVQLNRKRLKLLQCAVYVLVALFIYGCPSESHAGAILWTALTTTVRFAVAMFFVDFSTGIPAQSIISAIEAWNMCTRDQQPLHVAFVHQLCVLVFILFAAGLVELNSRSRIAVLLQSESMVTSFRRVLRGVCDGEVLLDSKLRISGKAGCLQSLLMTGAGDFGNKNFEELLGKDFNIPKVVCS